VCWDDQLQIEGRKMARFLGAVNLGILPSPELIQTDLVTKISPESPAMVVHPVPTFGVFWGIPPQV
jgi:hypothetical protein